MISTSRRELTTLRGEQRINRQEMERMQAAAAAETARLTAEFQAQQAALRAVGTTSANRPRVPATEDRPAPGEPRERQRRREAARVAPQANRRRPQPVVIAGVESRAAGALSPTVNVQAPSPTRGGRRRRAPGEDRADSR